MNFSDERNNILDRIAAVQHTEADIAALRQLLESGDRQIAVQLGKYNVNIGEGKEIHIGDRIYVEWNHEAIQKLLEVIQKQSDSIPLLPKELPQEDYLRLKNLLASGRWREANETTRRIILKAGQGEKEGWLSDEQIQNFPNSVLKFIDRLWLQYSDQRFGFSVQKRIFNECEQNPQAFGDRVGWYVGDAWISASQVIYPPANAPEGHLPWGIVSAIAIDNAALDAFVNGLRAFTKTTIRQDWQKQLLTDFMAVGGFLTGDKVDKEEFKRSLEYELSHDEAWWEGKRLEELKVRKLFSLFATCPSL
jgi:GUN4-like/Effector-associated domain 10